MKKSYDEFQRKCDFRMIAAFCALLAAILFSAIVRFGPELHHSGKRKDRERGAGSRRYHHSLGNPAGRNDRRSGQLLPAAGQKARRGCIAPRLLPGLQVPDPAHRQPHVVRHRAPGGEHLDGRSGRRGLRHHAEKGPDGVALLDRRRSDPQPPDPDHLAGPSGRHAGRDGHPHQLGAGRLGPRSASAASPR